MNQQIHLVLRHDNVLGRDDKIVHSSVTQVDLHDFSRLTLTYDLGGFHCITAMEAQHRISGEVLSYWLNGPGREYNPDRLAALEKLSLHRDFDDFLSQLGKGAEQPPLIIGTSAKPCEKTLDFPDAFSIIKRSGRMAVLQFGTSWGLSADQIRRCDWVLPPIEGRNGYNHLSVRCAAAIIVDRLTRFQA